MKPFWIGRHSLAVDNAKTVTRGELDHRGSELDCSDNEGGGQPLNDDFVTDVVHALLVSVERVVRQVRG
jgi:hypothetical protein